jgi:hypothetical protein
MNTTRTHPHVPRRFASFREFYPFYLSEHSDPICRRLHVFGTSFALVLLMTALVAGQYALLWLVPVAGYAFAWIGHYFFQHNHPATFKYPIYSFVGDFFMLRDVITGRIRW